MPYLLLTSLLWAFSFVLVKKQLAGIDAIALSTLRLGIATLVFLPFLRPSKIPPAAWLRLGGIGAIQFGLMYVLYLQSFAHLKAFEVAFFTVFTPIYVVLLDALLERRWRARYLHAALLAVAGAALVLTYGNLSENQWKGFTLIQASNLCFALGQLLWRRERARLKTSLRDLELFAIPYAGALLLTALVSLGTTHWQTFTLTQSQLLTVAYLGLVASGLCFFLWNLGAERVNAGTLAALNNAKMPIAVAVALLLGGEQANLPLLLLGGAAVGFAAWWASWKQS